MNTRAFSFIKINNNKLILKLGNRKLIIDIPYQIKEDKLYINGKKYQISDHLLIEFNLKDIIYQDIENIKINKCIIYDKRFDFKIKNGYIDIKQKIDGQLCPFYKINNHKYQFYFNNDCIQTNVMVYSYFNITDLHNNKYKECINKMINYNENYDLQLLKRLFYDNNLDYYLNYNMNLFQRLKIYKIEQFEDFEHEEDFKVQLFQYDKNDYSFKKSEKIKISEILKEDFIDKIDDNCVNLLIFNNESCRLFNTFIMRSRQENMYLYMIYIKDKNVFKGFLKRFQKNKIKNKIK